METSSDELLGSCSSPMPGFRATRSLTVRLEHHNMADACATGVARYANASMVRPDGETRATHSVAAMAEHGLGHTWHWRGCIASRSPLFREDLARPGANQNVVEAHAWLEVVALSELDGQLQVIVLARMEDLGNRLGPGGATKRGHRQRESWPRSERAQRRVRRRRCDHLRRRIGALRRHDGARRTSRHSRASSHAAIRLEHISSGIRTDAISTEWRRLADDFVLVSL